MIFASEESIVKYTNLGIWSEKTLLDYFLTHVKETPDRVCLVDPYDREVLTGTKPERLTYKEFAKTVDATATALLNLGVGRDDIVMVQLPNVWELAMLYLAIARVGAIITPVPVLWRKAELEHVAKLTEAKAFITISSFHSFDHLTLGKSLQTELTSLKHVLSLDQIRKMSQCPVSGKLSEIPIDANDIFSICWTSGTEAQSKGCQQLEGNHGIPGTRRNSSG